MTVVRATFITKLLTTLQNISFEIIQDNLKMFTDNENVL